MAPPQALSDRRALVLVAAVALADVVLALEPGPGGAFSSWWTSVGLGVALVALLPVRRWLLAVPALLVVAVLARLVTGSGAEQALESGGVQTLEALAGALVVTRGGRRRARLVSQRDLLWLLGAAVTCGAVAAVHAALRSEDLLSDRPGQAALQHLVSTLLIAAAVLLAHRVRLHEETVVELAVQSVVLVAATAYVFSPGQDVPLAFLLVPLLVWAALRFDTGVVAVQLVVFALAVSWASAHAAGPFDGVISGDAGDDRTGLVVQAYLLSVTLIVLPLALTVRSRADLLHKVRDDERLFRLTFTTSPLGMLLLRSEDDRLVVHEANASATRIFGAGGDDVTGRALGELLATDDPRERGIAALRRGEASEWRGDGSVVTRPGSRVEVSIAALEQRDGERLFSAQLLDVTMAHDAHRRLVDANRLNDATLDTTACIILVTDDTGHVVRVNAATEELTGFSDADLVGQPLWEVPLAPLSRVETEAMFVWPNRSGFPMVSERIGRTAAGDPVRVVWSNNVVRDDAGRPSYAVLTGIDVTAERSTTGLMSHMLSASIATALLGIDGRGVITIANAGAARMLGWGVHELLGRPFVELFDAEQLHTRTGAVGDHDAFLCLAGTIGDRDESLAREWTWRTRHGQELIVSMTLSVTEDLGAGRLGFLCVGRDVTAQRQGQETLVAALEKERTAVERLRALDEAKDEIVSTVSHELRTPVTTIMGYTEMLRDGTVAEPSEDQLPLLERISRNSERLLAICNDLLLLSGFESGTSVTVHTRVDLRDCVTAAYDALIGVPEADGVEIHLHPGDDALEVVGDRGQLDRVAANLLSNALKFTPTGGRVDVTLSHRDGRAVLEVRDTGIGIAPEDHDAVFQRFYRTFDAQHQAIPGTGLGLPIVAAVVVAHDGSITLESEPGQGTTFRVELPLVEQLAPA